MSADGKICSFENVLANFPADPIVASITRQTPAASPTNANSLTWRVTFSEGVQNVDAADFTVGGTTATVTNVATVSASTYDVTVSGGDLANLNATVTLGFVGTQNIQDLAGNALTDTTPTGTNNNTYVVQNDTTLPSVQILNAPNRVTTVNPFTVTFQFSEAVTGFVLGDITVGNGTASGFVAVDADTYTVIITPRGAGDVTIDVAAGVAQDLAANLNTAATQVVVQFTDGALRTQRVISNFMSRRADQITASDPDLVERLTGGGGGNGGGGPVGFNGGGSVSNNQLAFSTSLRQIVGAGQVAKAKQREELGQMMSLGQQSLAGTSIDNGSGFDVWVQGSWARINSDAADSDIGLLYVGADYRFGPGLLVGLLTQFDWTDESDDVQSTSAEGNGFLVGPYVVARLHDNLIFDARAAWGRSDNEVSPFGTYTDSFDTDRWLVRGRLTGDFNQGNWHFAPHVGVIYFEEDQNSYTDSLGIFIPDQSVSLGRVTFGPKVSTRVQVGGGTVIAPHIGIKGIWDFERAEVVDLVSGLAVGSDDLRARVEGGLSVLMGNGWSLDGESFYDGIGADDFEAYGGSMKLTVPLN